MTGPNAYERKKDSQGVRRALLNKAAHLAAEQGLAAVTVEAVARAAGVTKGGLFHHFPNKSALIYAMFADLLAHFDAAIDARMAQDPVAHGRFTRAYLEAVFTDQALGDDNPSAALSVSTIADPELLGEWSTWLAQRLEQHAATDDNALCEVVRLAADGVWLISISPDPTSPINFARARAAMLALTMLGA